MEVVRFRGLSEAEAENPLQTVGTLDLAEYERAIFPISLE
jgi:hypothetical protein